MAEMLVRDGRAEVRFFDLDDPEAGPLDDALVRR
jgi:hypothetical protein